ncbi:MAG TPA: sulfatase [Planctomycetota bacterium]|nr:sulfatase [Planctomycetota bacterium]
MRWAAIAVLLCGACGPTRPEQSAGVPNILFCVADDWGWPHAGAYGCSWVKTPAFDRVAREGLLFTRAYTPNAKCAPSRASLLTGRNSWQLEEAANHVCYFPSKFRTYPEALARHGYFVGMTGKGWGPGNPGLADGKPRELAGPPFQARTLKPPTSGISNRDYAANFRDFLDARPAGRRWCFWYGGHEPHRGYEFGSGVSKGGKKTSDLDRVPGFWPDTPAVRNDVLDYAFEVEHFDRQLEKMLALLEERGELDNTIIVVTSDNGMPFPRMKAQEYELSNHMPLAIRWKNGIRAPGRTVDDYVSFVDLAPTFLELAGLSWETSGMAPSSGRALSDVFRSEAGGPRRDHVLIGKERHDIGRPNDQGYPIRGILKDGMLYLHNFEASRWPGGNPETGYLECDGGPSKTEVLQRRRQGGDLRSWDLCFGKRGVEELYDVRTDPDCLRNLEGDPARRALKESLREQLFRELKEQGDPRMSGQGELFDRYPYSEEPLRGFYEKYKSGKTPKAGWVNPSDFEKEPLD